MEINIGTVGFPGRETLIWVSISEKIQALTWNNQWTDVQVFRKKQTAAFLNCSLKGTHFRIITFSLQPICKTSVISRLCILLELGSLL